MTQMTVYAMQNCLASDYQHVQTVFANLAVERRNWIINNHTTLFTAIQNGTYHPSIGQHIDGSAVFIGRPTMTRTELKQKYAFYYSKGMKSWYELTMNEQNWILAANSSAFSAVSGGCYTDQAFAPVDHGPTLFNY